MRSALPAVAGLAGLTCTLASAAAVNTAPVEGDCLSNYPWFKAADLSSSSRVSCRGTALQQKSDIRWGTQFQRNAGLVVFPGTSQDTAKVVQMLNKAPSTLDWSFVSGGHGEINATSANDFMVDLTWMNSTTVISDFKPEGATESFTAIKYQSGARWGDVNEATASSGYVAVGARMSSVGVGGFSTGGGIGFLAAAYGYASDRLRQMEVVLPNGDLVNATKNNEYSDLFFALRGGNGQFGIVTAFWQEAVPKPQKPTMASYPIPEENRAQARADLVRFFNENQDPFASLNYVMIYTNTLGVPSIREVLVAQHFDSPESSGQLDFNATFFDYLKSTVYQIVPQNILPYEMLQSVTVDPSFPFGKRRGFYGPPVASIDVAFIEKASARFNTYINDLIANGDDPSTSTWMVQYLHPGMNGKLPASDSESAWPHSKAGHLTLFGPAWMAAENDGIVFTAVADFNDHAFARQTDTKIPLTDYINYISPPTETKDGRKGWKGARYWGDNVARLNQIKEKYDANVSSAAAQRLQARVA